MTPRSCCEGQQWLCYASAINRRILVFLLLIPGYLFASDPVASTVSQSKPAIALIIDDMGNDWEHGKQAINLPGPVTCAFLPYGAYTRRLAHYAHEHDKEVMLHLPMQSVDDQPLDPGGLTLDMTESVLAETLLRDLAAVPYVAGINNHMGSLLTRHPGHMNWLMTILQQQGRLFFVDSRTTDHSVARQLAAENAVPNLQRDVFLDVERDQAAILSQFLKLVEKAKRNGAALGIGHPYPETLAVLRREISSLQDYELQLVSVGQLIELRQQKGKTWHASLSR